MTTKHTPGPWKVNESRTFKAGWDIDGPVGKGHIATTYPYGDVEIEKANARLIAAAPEMAELLKESVSPSKDADDFGAKWYNDARALLERIDG